jgi:cytochrome c oxidase subunit IV
VTTAAPELDDDSPVHPGEHHDHGPADGYYFKVFWALVLITALEVSTYWWEDWFGRPGHYVGVPVLIGLMVLKFFMVALIFMHLRYDSPVLKRTFYFAMVIAIIVYLVMLAVLNIWNDSGNKYYDDPPPNAVPTTLVAEGG